MNIKKIVKNNAKLSIILGVIIVLGTIGITFAAVASNFNPIAVNTTTGTLDAVIDYTGAANTSVVTSTETMLPINDSIVEEAGTTIDDERVVKAEFNVSGASTNPENTIYDVALYTEENGIDCELRTEDLKWKLYKDGTEISNGNLSPAFDTMDNGRLVLTTTQQDLTTTSSKYVFLLWISESCPDSLENCDASMDQSKYLNKELNATLKVELSTKSKKTNQRVTSTENSCNYSEIDIPICNNAIYNGNSQILVNDNTNYTVQNAVATEVGKYSVLLNLADGYKWTDGTTGNKTISCNVNKKDIAITTLEQEVTYGDDIATGVDQVTIDELIEGHSLSSITINSGKVDVGTSVVEASNAKIVDTSGNDVTNNYGIRYNNIGRLTINCSSIATMPTIISNLEYNGEEQNGITGGTYVDIAGPISATESGTYTVEVTPQKNYCWEDGTTETETITWTIADTITIINLDNTDSSINGTTKIYNRDGKYYLDAEYQKEMTTGNNRIDVPSKLGYVFDGYYTKENGAGSLMIDSNGYATESLLGQSYTGTILYPKWTEVYIITYVTDQTETESGIEIDSFTQEVNPHKSTVNLSSRIPVKLGYNFIGWSTTSSATTAEYSSNEEITITSNITLYAIWEIKTYTINYVANTFRGVTEGPSQGVTVSYDKETSYLTLDGTQTGTTLDIAVPYKGSFTTGDTYTVKLTYISGTYTKNDTSTFAFEIQKDEKNLNHSSLGYTRNYKALAYPTSGSTSATLTINSSGGTYGNMLQVWSYAKSSGAAVFGNYTVKVEIIKQVSITKTHDTNLPLNYKPERYGYEFLGWSTEENATAAMYAPGSSFTSNSNTILYAVWQSVEQININASNSSYGSVSINSIEVVPGTTYSTSGNTLTLSDGRTITATPTELAGYTTTFTGWSSTSGTINSTTNITANFSRSLTTYTISYNLDGGSVSENPTSYNIETASFTLQNPTKEGYTFLGWTGSNGTTPSTSVSISKGSTGNKNYTANWQINTYTIDYQANILSGVNERTVNGLTISFDESTSYLTLNGSPTASLDIGVPLYSPFYANDSYIAKITYVSGSMTQSDNSTIAFEFRQNGSNLTERNFIDFGYPTSGSYEKILTVSSYSATNADALHFNLWINSANAVSFSNYTIKVELIKHVTVTKTHDTNITLDYTPNKLGHKFLGWSTDSNATTATYSPGATFTSNANTTLYPVWKAYNVNIQYSTNGGTLATTSNDEGTWTTDSNGIVSKNNVSSFTTITYGGTLGQYGLNNWNNSSSLNISRSGYTAVSGAEWICLSGCTTANKTYNHDDAYAASDFCDASSGDCTVVLGVNWTEDNTVNATKYVCENTSANRVALYYVTTCNGDTCTYTSKNGLSLTGGYDFASLDTSGTPSGTISKSTYSDRITDTGCTTNPYYVESGYTLNCRTGASTDGTSIKKTLSSCSSAPVYRTTMIIPGSTADSSWYYSAVHDCYVWGPYVELWSDSGCGTQSTTTGTCTCVDNYVSGQGWTVQDSFSCSAMGFETTSDCDSYCQLNYNDNSPEVNTCSTS